MSKDRERKEKMSGKSQPSQWVLDSGASHHMTSNIHVFANLHILSEPINIGLTDRRIIVAEKAGKMNLVGGLTLKEVLYTPTFTCNLISIQ